MKNKGLKISRKKTVYPTFNGYGKLDGNSDINIQGEHLERVTLLDNGDLDAKMTRHRIQPGWKRWKRVSGVCLTEE